MKQSDLEKRVAELERQVRELQAAPKEQHFHYYPPVYQQPYTPYVSPATATPWRWTIGDPQWPYGTTITSSGTANIPPFNGTTCIGGSANQEIL